MTKEKNNPKAREKIRRKYGRLGKEKTKALWCSIALWFIHLALQYQAALVLEWLKGMKKGIYLKQASRRMRQKLLNHFAGIKMDANTEECSS